MLQNKNAKQREEVSLQTFSMCFISRADLISRDQTLSSTDAASMHNRIGPLCQMLWGRAHTSFLVQTPPPHFFFPFQATAVHTNVPKGCRKAHTERHSPPRVHHHLCITCCLFFLRSPLHDSGADV